MQTATERERENSIQSVFLQCSSICNSNGAVSFSGKTPVNSIELLRSPRVNARMNKINRHRVPKVNIYVKRESRQGSIQMYTSRHVVVVAVQKCPSKLLSVCVCVQRELISAGCGSFSLSDPFVRLKLVKKKKRKEMRVSRVFFIFRNWRKKEFNDAAT